MEPITIIGYILSALIVGIPLVYTYSKKLGLALSFIYEFLNIISSYMNGDLDHEFTDSEKLALADSVIALGKRIDENLDIDAILNFKK
jgi:hypothetical protein